MAIVGIIPAAGFAVRLQPLPCSKEVLDVGGRPIMDVLVDRMQAGGADEIRVVTRPEKEDVIEAAERRGATVVLGYPVNVNASFALGMGELAPDDLVLLGFPDSIWEPEDGYRRLVAAVEEEGHDVALGLFRTPGLEGSDYLVFHEDGTIAGIDIKPAVPRSEWIWGAAAARVDAMAGLDGVEWPSQHMLALRDRGRSVGAVRLSDRYLDVGTHSSLERLPAFLG